MRAVVWHGKSKVSVDTVPDPAMLAEYAERIFGKGASKRDTGEAAAEHAGAKPRKR